MMRLEKSPSTRNYDPECLDDAYSLRLQAAEDDGASTSTSTSELETVNKILDCPDRLQAELGITYALLLAAMTNTPGYWNQTGRKSLKVVAGSFMRNGDKGIVKPGSERSTLEVKTPRLYQLQRKKTWRTIYLDAVRDGRLSLEDMPLIPSLAMTIVRDYKLNTLEPERLQEFNQILDVVLEGVCLRCYSSCDEDRNEQLLDRVENAWKILQDRRKPGEMDDAKKMDDAEKMDDAKKMDEKNEMDEIQEMHEIKEMIEIVQKMRRSPVGKLSRGEELHDLAAALCEIWEKLGAHQQPLPKRLIQFMDGLLALFNNSQSENSYLARSWILTGWVNATTAIDRLFFEQAVPAVHLSELARFSDTINPDAWEGTEMRPKINPKLYIPWAASVYDLKGYLGRAAERDVTLKNFKRSLHRADWAQGNYACRLVYKYLLRTRVRSKPQIALGVYQGFALALRINGQPLDYEKADSEVPGSRVVHVYANGLLTLCYQPLDLATKQNLLFIPLGMLFMCPDSAFHPLTRVRQCFLLGQGI